MQSVKCGVWSVECVVWDVECEVWSGKCGVWSVMCGELSVECVVWSAKYYWEVPRARFVVQSSTGKCLVQDVQYKVVLGNILRKICSIK